MPDAPPAVPPLDASLRLPEIPQAAGGLAILVPHLPPPMQAFLQGVYAPRCTEPGGGLRMPDLGYFTIEAARACLESVRPIVRDAHTVGVVLVPEHGDDRARFEPQTLSARLLCAMAQAWQPGDEPFFPNLQQLSIQAKHPAFIDRVFLRLLIHHHLRTFELDLSFVEGPTRADELPSVSTMTWLQTGLSRCASLETLKIRLPRKWTTFKHAGEPIWEEERAFHLVVRPLLAGAMTAQHVLVTPWTMHTKSSLTAFALCLPPSLLRLVLAPEPSDSLLELLHDTGPQDDGDTLVMHPVDFARPTTLRLLRVRPCQVGRLLAVTSWSRLVTLEVILRPHFDGERFTLQDLFIQALVDGAPDLQRLLIGVDNLRLKPNAEHPEQSTDLSMSSLAGLDRLDKMRFFGLHLGCATDVDGEDEMAPAAQMSLGVIIVVVERWAKLRQFRADPPRPGHSCFDFASGQVLLSLRRHCPALEVVELRLDPASLPLSHYNPFFPVRQTKIPLFIELELPAGTIIDQRTHRNDAVHRFVVDLWEEENVRHTDYTLTTLVAEGFSAPPTWYARALSELG